MTGVAPEHIIKLLKQGTVATVELVTSKATYVELCGRRVQLCSREFGVIPNGISVDSLPKLSVGQTLSCGDIQVTAAKQDPDVCSADYTAALNCLKADPGTGFGLLVTDRELPPECQIAQPLLKGLYAGILKVDTVAMEPNILGLLGLGKGLTPSGDDVLAGLIYGLRHSPLREERETVFLLETAQNYATERTNAVSADYLRAMTADAPFERLKNGFDCPKKLMEIGSNSGRELLLGRILAAHIVTVKGSENGVYT